MHVSYTDIQINSKHLKKEWTSYSSCKKPRSFFFTCPVGIRQVLFLCLTHLSESNLSHLHSWLYVFTSRTAWSNVGCEGRAGAVKCFLYFLCVGFRRNAAVWLSKGNDAKTFRRFLCNGHRWQQKAARHPLLYLLTHV